MAKSKSKSSRVKKEKTTPKKSVLKKESPIKSPKKEDEEEYKWWLEENRDDTIKWNTLSHNGVFFPPDYEPHGVKMKYKGKEIKLSANSEEVASFYAALIGTDWVKNDIFTKNFFNDFMQVCTSCFPNYSCQATCLVRALQLPSSCLLQCLVII